MKEGFILRKLFLNDFWSHRFLVLFKNMPDLVLWAINTTKYFHTFKKLALKYILLLTTIYLIYYGILWIWPNAIHTDHYSLHHNLFCSYSNAIFFAKKNIIFCVSEIVINYTTMQLIYQKFPLMKWCIGQDYMQKRTYFTTYCIFGSLQQKHRWKSSIFFTFLGIFKHE